MHDGSTFSTLIGLLGLWSTLDRMAVQVVKMGWSGRTLAMAAGSMTLLLSSSSSDNRCELTRNAGIILVMLLLKLTLHGRHL